MPHCVACPQLCLDLGSDDVSGTPLLLQLKSWEAERFGSPSPLVSCLVHLALGVSDQGPLTLMGVSTTGHPRKGSAGGPRFGVQGPYLGHFWCHLFGTPTLLERV